MSIRFRGLPRLAPLMAIVFFPCLFSCAVQSSSYSVYGVVIDHATGQGIAGVSISLEQDSSVSTTTAGDGSYVLDGVPHGTFKVVARMTGRTLIPRRADSTEDNSVVYFGGDRSVVLNFSAVDSGTVTISMIQGTGFTSPLEGQSVAGVVGVITQVTYKAPHAVYDTVIEDGSSVPQWVSEDGFYMESLAADNDGDPATSDGIFVYTHNDSYTDSKWLDSVPSDLKPGDVVSVSGLVTEYRPIDRFNNSAGYRTVTRITAPTILHVTSLGVNTTAPYPAGVLLTYENSPTLPSGVTESRTLPWNVAGKFALRDAALMLESVEGMVVRADNPRVTTSTYYNVTGFLANNGQKGGVDNPHVNTAWGGIVLQNTASAGLDFNSELLFCDYQKPTWTTFSPIPQTGDYLKDSDGAFVLRGVMDYTADALYMIKPLQFDTEPTDAVGNVIPSQGWDFNACITTPDMKTITSARLKAGGAIHDWRIGSAADARFRVPSSWGTAPEANYIKVASFNLENFENQGKPYGKDADIADIIYGNLRCPDLVIVIEMGDDKLSTIIYENQANAYAIPDGVVTAVRNFRAISDSLYAKSGIRYDFRSIDPEENADGGEPGTNIRVGFLFRTDTLSFVDRGLATNYYGNTSGAESSWPVAQGSALALELATTATAVTRESADQSPAISQSPGRIIDASFSSSRKPLVGEFIQKATGHTFFAIAAHLNSKGGDDSLYGEVQPPSFGSETKRTRQAESIRNFVNRILAMDSGARVVVAGDMNDFPWSDPLKALMGTKGGSRVLWSPTQMFMPANEQWSYAYRGNLQQIDHIFLSRSLYDGIAAAGLSDWTSSVFIAHIDSPFSKNNHVQTSDHDAVAARLYIGD